MSDPSDGAVTGGGLRARSKARRRDLIQRTAMRLFAERGYDETTVADVAEAAEVAPRTVSGYFPSKLELATAFADDLATRLTASFRSRPDADLLDLLDQWLVAVTDSLDPELARLALAMYRTNPGLGALGSAHLTESAELGAAAIAARVGLPVDHPMIAVRGATIGATLGEYLKAIATGDDVAGLRESVLAYLGAVLAPAAADVT
ncbi:transcriptional regulator, TetR family [Jatrophihabitans endophyticus]|uniref:Transcriptional regulator, TetR family n=1 Tax=Jatrophihabitans endophyticus TaxID=1206085 RepID=A0A1M5SSV6_9ACTN|nr:TetR/AcrR family transcriptional regulator [Jatrophihabitans endophyticus]SHH41043.1 transcriptional regulator, TetR family [Jatrophihabitans endophyticus]